MEKLHLISGMPRSGSTLLCNLLNMNPKFHATATSPVIDVINAMRTTFSHNPTFKSNDRLNQYDNMRRGFKGFINGFYHDKRVVFDKCRGWSNNLPLLDAILGHSDTKVIWTYRNPVDIVSSIEKHHQKTILLENMDEINGSDLSTLTSRVDNFINDGGIVARPVWLLNDAYEMGYANRILIVTYWDLTNKPQETLNKIHDFLGEDRYQYDILNFTDLKQTTKEFDSVYNFKFPHTINEGSVSYVKHNVNLPPYLKKLIRSFGDPSHVAIYLKPLAILYGSSPLLLAVINDLIVILCLAIAFLRSVLLPLYKRPATSSFNQINGLYLCCSIYLPCSGSLIMRETLLSSYGASIATMYFWGSCPSKNCSITELDTFCSGINNFLRKLLIKA